MVQFVSPDCRWKQAGQLSCRSGFNSHSLGKGFNPIFPVVANLSIRFHPRIDKWQQWPEDEPLTLVGVARWAEGGVSHGGGWGIYFLN